MHKKDEIDAYIHDQLVFILSVRDVCLCYSDNETVKLFYCFIITVVLFFIVLFVTLFSAPGQHCRVALYKFIL